MIDLVGFDADGRECGTPMADDVADRQFVGIVWGSLSAAGVSGPAYVFWMFAVNEALILIKRVCETCSVQPDGPAPGETFVFRLFMLLIAPFLSLPVTLLPGLLVGTLPALALTALLCLGGKHLSSFRRWWVWSGTGAIIGAPLALPATAIFEQREASEYPLIMLTGALTGASCALWARRNAIREGAL